MERDRRRRRRAWVTGVLSLATPLIFGNLFVSHAGSVSRAVAGHGERLVRELNCAACHQLGKALNSSFPEARLVGPDLSQEGGKVRAEWLFDFLKNPQPLRPGIQARMPRFRLSDAEALAITLYLSSLRPKSVSASTVSLRSAASPGAENLKKGKEYFESLECAKCHFPPGRESTGKLSAQELGPDLGLARIRLKPDWVLRWLKDPQAIQPGTKMPNFFYDEGEFIDDDAEKMMLGVRDYLMASGEVKPSSNFRKARSRFPQVSAARGRELMVELNCTGCHQVRDLPKPRKVGPILAFEGERVKREWLVRFLSEPRIIRPMDPATMPDFSLSKKEASAIAFFIDSRWRGQGGEKSLSLGEKELTTELVKAGKRLWEEELGCSSCHRVGAQGSIGAPILTGVGKRLNAAWLFRWVKDPKHFLPQTPMPRVPLTDDEARALVAFLMKQK